MEVRDLKERARSLFHGAKPQVLCSAPAAGEFAFVLAKDIIEQGGDVSRYEDAMRTFYQYVEEGKLICEMFGSSPSRAFEIAFDLQAEDPQLSPTDIAILACFLADRESSVLYTTDQDIQTSLAVSGKVRAASKRIRDLPSLD